LLIGIVKENAILIVDFAVEAERGESRRRSRSGRSGAQPAPTRRSQSMMRSSSIERAIFSARRCATLCEPHTVTRRPSSSVVVESSRASAVPQTAQVVWLGAVLRSRLPYAWPDGRSRRVERPNFRPPLALAELPREP